MSATNTQICDYKDQKDVKLLLRILSNIIGNPNKKKYCNLKRSVIETKLSKYCVDILLVAGFENKIQNNSKRIIFNTQHIDSLKYVNQTLINYKQNKNKKITLQDLHTKIKTVVDLMKNGFTVEEAEKGFTLSTTIDDNNLVNINNVDDAVAAIVKMGFDAAKARYAYIQSSYNINLAIQILLGDSDIGQKSLNSFRNNQQARPLHSTYFNVKNDCNGSILQCPSLVRLKKMMMDYKGDISDTYIKNITQIMNDFTHLIINHDQDNDFDYIYNEFDTCNISTCNITPRYYRTINSINDNDYNVYKQIMDKIHCHFMHSYDYGYRSRLTLNQRQQTATADDLKQNADDIDEKQLISNNVLTLPKTIKSSANKFTQLTTANVISNNNEYNYGELFYYWDHFKNSQIEYVARLGYKQRDWYVACKYKTFKKELLNNEVATISYQQWVCEMNKAVEHNKTDYSKTLIAHDDSKAAPRDCTESCKLYAIKIGTKITLQHLIAVAVYCGQTDLAYKFGETFRRLNSSTLTKFDDIKPNTTHTTGWGLLTGSEPTNQESYHTLKQRHSNFYHLSKHLNEAITIYSKPDYRTKYKKFYHGIAGEMVFNSLTCYMYQPFSTTTSPIIALTFSGASGLILELNCNPYEKYFDCRWISDFSNENELLFISCAHRLIFSNIKQLSTGIDFNIFVKAISIIDFVTTGLLFQEDNTVILNLVNAAADLENRSKKYKGMFVMNGLNDFQNFMSLYTATKTFSKDPKLYGGNEITATLKLLTIRLIKHELNRYLPDRFDRIDTLPPYIDKLLHCVCVHKNTVGINWEIMNIEIANKFTSGYQGYRFLKYLFCEDGFQGIKLNFIATLFPNATDIGLSKMTNITQRFMDNIWNYLSINKRLFQIISLSLSKQAMIQKPTMMQSVLDNNQQRFKNIGCVIEVDDECMQIVRQFDPSLVQTLWK